MEWYQAHRDQGQTKLVLSLASFSSLENVAKSAFLRKVKYFLTFEYRNGVRWHCPQKLIKVHRVLKENDVQPPYTCRSNFIFLATFSSSLPMFIHLSGWKVRRKRRRCSFTWRQFIKEGCFCGGAPLADSWGRRKACVGNRSRCSSAACTARPCWLFWGGRWGGNVSKFPQVNVYLKWKQTNTTSPGVSSACEGCSLATTERCPPFPSLVVPCPGRVAKGTAAATGGSGAGGAAEPR